MERINLHPEQAKAVEKMSGEFTRAAINASELGVGKTIMAVSVAQEIGAKTVLIVAPLHTRYGWQDTFKRQEIDLPFSFVNNKNKAGRIALGELTMGVPGVYFCGREWFRLQNWAGTHVDMLIYDEVHSISSRRSRGALSLRKLSRGYTLLQSATWFGSSFEGAWSVTRAAWPEMIDPSFPRWRDEWCATEYDRFTYDRKKITGELNPGAFAGSLPCYVRLEANKTFPVVFEDVYVDLGKAERTQYDSMEKEAVAWLQNEGLLVADIPMTKRVRLRQLLLGTANFRTVERKKVNDEGVQETYLSDQVFFTEDTVSAKLDALKEILADLGGEKVLISEATSSDFAKIAAERIGAFAWVGDASQVEREAAKKRFIEGDLQYIVAHPAAISEGTDGLQRACRVLVILSESDQPVLNQQLIGRLDRTGQERQVVVIRVRAKDTIDDPQAETLLVKELKMRESLQELPQ